MDSIWIVLIPSPFANMAPLYEIDPDADVLVLVPPKKTPFAPWRPANAISSTPPPGTDNLTKSTALTSTTGLRLKVSSKHLTLASRVFKNKLSFFHKRTSVQSDGRIHLQLAEGFDTRAVAVVLNALHPGRGSRRVPRVIDGGLEGLAQVAWFVDRFELGDAVDVYGERWVGSLLLEGRDGERGYIGDFRGEKEGEEGYGRDLVLWLYIGFVFRRGGVFGDVSKDAIYNSRGLVRTLGLPIRERIIRDIDTQRQKLLSKTIEILNSALDELVSLDGCQSYCDRFLLGELVKTLKQRKMLSWPTTAEPQPPLSGVSFADVVRAIDDSLAKFESVRAAVASPEVKANPLGVHQNVNGKTAPYTNGTKQLPTPGSSPVLYDAVVNGKGLNGHHSDAGVHECDVAGPIEKLKGIRRLGDDVKGLKLESEFGYQIYR